MALAPKLSSRAGELVALVDQFCTVTTPVIVTLRVRSNLFKEWRLEANTPIISYAWPGPDYTRDSAAPQQLLLPLRASEAGVESALGTTTEGGVLLKRSDSVPSLAK
jgi:hypothetical protein